MRRPQTSKASFGQYSQKSLLKPELEHNENDVCGKCCKAKQSLNRTMSKADFEK